MLHTTLGKILLSGALLFGGGGFLVYASLDDAQYYEMVDKVAEDPAHWIGKDLKIHGYVVPGSISHKVENQRTVRSFTLEMNNKRIPVRFIGPTPDNLKDRAEVVAQGKLSDSNGELMFDATELMAKCPSKYEGAQSNKDLF